MRRRAVASTGEPSYDSFLDIVTNLVGILVILIMVLGVREDAWQAADRLPTGPEASASPVPALNPGHDVTHRLTRSSDVPLEGASPGSVSVAVDAESALAGAMPPTACDREPLPKVEATRRQAAAIREQLFELDEQAQRLAQELAIKRRYRGELQLQVHLAQLELGKIKKRYKESQETCSADLAAEIASADRKRRQLRQRIEALEATASAPTVLRNEPTPLARPVEGNEVHLRLLGGRVAYVPISEAVTRLSQVVAKKVWRLKNSYEVKDQLESRDGFTMHYTLVRQLHPGGRETPALGGFVMVPQSDNLGEAMAVAIGPNSDLAARLSYRNPRVTTVTVWTYPDSFAQFRDLRTYLLDRGFQVAARPLPAGYPIGGSPDGSRSAAQ